MFIFIENEFFRSGILDRIQNSFHYCNLINSIHSFITEHITLTKLIISDTSTSICYHIDYRNVSTTPTKVSKFDNAKIVVNIMINLSK